MTTKSSATPSDACHNFTARRAHHSAFHDSRVRQVRELLVEPLAARSTPDRQAAHGAKAYGHPLARLIDINPIPLHRRES